MHFRRKSCKMKAKNCEKRDILTVDKRQKSILNELEQSNQPIVARKLAEKFSVSRQIIVGDIALLRAAGHEILSTPKGYLLQKERASSSNEVKRKFACKHSIDETVDEINTIVVNGGKVIDVSIDHPIYGEITGALNIFTQADAKHFNEKVKKGETSLLSELTEGVHMHTIAADTMEQLDRIEEKLDDKGYLYKSN